MSILSTVTKVYLLRGQGLLPALPAGRRAAAPGKFHIPTNVVVAQEASDVESSSRLDFLLPHNLRRHFIA